jgi:hypothetical protein
LYPICRLHEIQIFPKKPKKAKIGQNIQNWLKRPKFSKKAKKAKFAQKAKISQN